MLYYIYMYIYSYMYIYTYVYAIIGLLTNKINLLQGRNLTENVPGLGTMLLYTCSHLFQPSVHKTKIRKKLIAVFYCACVVANFSDDRLTNVLE